MKLFALQDWLARVPYLSDWVRHYATDLPTDNARETKRQDAVLQRMKANQTAGSQAIERSQPDGSKFRKWKQPGNQSAESENEPTPDEETEPSTGTPKKGQYIDRYI